MTGSHGTVTVGGTTVPIGEWRLTPPCVPTDDGTALLRAIIAHPDEDTPRLMYADWLDEYSCPERAEFIRVQCESDRLRRETEHGAFACSSFTLSDGSTVLLRLNREQTKSFLESGERNTLRRVAFTTCADATSSVPLLVRLDAVLLRIEPRPHELNVTGTLLSRPRDVPRFHELVIRERELLAAHGYAWLDAPLVALESERHGRACEYRRGFVESLTCSAANWIAHGGEVVASQPVRRVTLTTWPTGYEIDGCPPEDVWAAYVKGELGKTYPGIEFQLPSR